MASAVAKAHVQQSLTKDYSTLKYKLEYGGYLSNHLLHGVVALFDLGASEEKIDDFAKHYAEKLEKEGPESEDVLQPEVLNKEKLTIESASSLIGKRENFNGLIALYGAEVKQHGVDGAVKKHLPPLVGGLAGALLHALIQLGYSYHIGGERLVAEGLAYMHYSYLTFDEPQAKNAQVEAVAKSVVKKTLSREEALQLAHALKDHEFLQSEVRRKMSTKPLADLDIGWLQRKLNTMSGHPERGSPAAFQLIWDTVNSYDLSAINGTFALDLSLWLYAMIDHSDFVTLHAVTAAWSLQQLEHLLEHDDKVRAWKVWLHVALSAFITEQIKDLCTTDICEKCDQELPVLESWDQIFAKTLALEGYPDEHVYKLVQVAYDHATRAQTPTTGSENGAFLTPTEREYIARKSALKVISEDFAPYLLHVRNNAWGLEP